MPTAPPPNFEGIPPMRPPIRFFPGLSSRYSYLATARIDVIAARHGRTVEWLPLHSPELIRRAGADPFAATPPPHQYRPAYRRRDVERWATLYGIPCIQPDDAMIDWRNIALAAVAAQRLGQAEPFVRAVQARSFGEGRPPRGPAELIALAQALGLDGKAFALALNDPSLADWHEATIVAALAAGAFSVPSFAVDSELFWGNDRLPLLEHHLATSEDRPAR